MIIIIGIFFMIVSFAVSRRLKNKFRKYSQIQLSTNATGKQIAEAMLYDHGITDVRVQMSEGELSDHYNPQDKTVNLSPDVFSGKSAAAAAVAAHECGHAIQHANTYSWLEFRSAMVPIQNVSAKILNIVVLVAIFGGAFVAQLPFENILLAIIACYAVITTFSLVTLPVEFDASKRALAWIQDKGVVNNSEYDMAKDALHWAAMTYVVAAIGSLVTLLYYVMMFLGNRD
ncbi:MAG: zinc metallopeptidase [Cyclobacteriaceae bacterium]|nr:zinc metallopeptidase [Cyclobacteriaceae bacterium]MCH8517169.1 zinc metallopeptidase [Cyclobacteriaceae bacterium]